MNTIERPAAESVITWMKTEQDLGAAKFILQQAGIPFTELVYVADETFKAPLQEFPTVVHICYRVANPLKGQRGEPSDVTKTHTVTYAHWLTAMCRPSEDPNEENRKA